MKGTGLTLPLFLPWEVHEEAARQATKDRIVEVERSIGRPDDNYVALLVRLQPVHLLHELCNNPTVRQGITGFSGQPGAEQGIEFVNENDTRGQPARKRENGANKLLSLADVLGACQPSAFTESCVTREIRINLTMSMISEGETTSILQPASLARARTTSVLPVPGGPKRRQPVMLCSFKIPCWNAPGCKSGKETIVRIESIVCGERWTWLNVVVMDAGNFSSG